MQQIEKNRQLAHDLATEKSSNEQASVWCVGSHF